MAGVEIPEQNHAKMPEKKILTFKQLLPAGFALSLSTRLMLHSFIRNAFSLSRFTHNIILSLLRAASSVTHLSPTY
jgi:hypothetical protein